MKSSATTVRPGIELPGLDFCEIARGHGVPAARAERPEGLDEALRWVLASNGPALLDVALDQGVAKLYREKDEA